MCSIASAASDLLLWRSWTSFCFTACCKATSSARKSPPLKWINLSPQAVSHFHRFDVVVYKRTFEQSKWIVCMWFHHEATECLNTIHDYMIYINGCCDWVWSWLNWPMIIYTEFHSLLSYEQVTLCFLIYLYFVSFICCVDK